MVEWSKATDCNSVITAGSNPAPTSTLNTFIMETNNLTPDENLKEPIYFNKDEEPAKVRNTVEAPGIDSGDSIVHPDYIPDEELAETGAGVIAVLFASLALLIIVAIIFCSIYFK